MLESLASEMESPPGMIWNLECWALIFLREYAQGGVENTETCLDQSAGHIQSAAIENERLSMCFEAIQKLVKWSKVVEVGFLA